jgi:hypothetical protein
MQKIDNQVLLEDFIILRETAKQTCNELINDKDTKIGPRTEELLNLVTKLQGKHVKTTTYTVYSKR